MPMCGYGFFSLWSSCLSLSFFICFLIYVLDCSWKGTFSDKLHTRTSTSSLTSKRVNLPFFDYPSQIFDLLIFISIIVVLRVLVGAKLPSRLQESSPKGLLTKPGFESGVPGFTNLLRNCANTIAQPRAKGPYSTTAMTKLWVCVCEILGITRKKMIFLIETNKQKLQV